MAEQESEPITRQERMAELRARLGALGREYAPYLPQFIRFDFAALAGRILDYEHWTPPLRFQCEECGSYTDIGLYDDSPPEPGMVVRPLCDSCMERLIESVLVPEAVSDAR